MVIDDIVEPDNLRKALELRLDAYQSKNLHFTERKHGVYPV